MNDQIFAIGDKVMRVASAVHRAGAARIHPNGMTRFDTVYCVSDCWWSPPFQEHRMELVGFPCTDYEHGVRVGFRTANFRRVEDLKVERKARESAGLPA